MRVVLDTNVLVSGILSPHGPPGRILALVASGELILCHDARILVEYAEVLHRPRFGFDPARVDLLLHQIVAEGERTTAVPLDSALPDVDDEPFLEIAAAADCPLVTGNLRHYPDDERGNVRVLPPADYLRELRKD